MMIASSPAASAVGTRPARARGSKFGRRRRLVGLTLAAPALILILAFFVVPLGQTIGMSLYKWPILGARTFVGLQNYANAFADQDFAAAVLFTLVYTAIVTPLLLVAGLVLVGIVQRRTRAARVFQTIYFLPVCIGFAASSYVFLFMFQTGIGPAWSLLRSMGIIGAEDNLFAEIQTAVGVVLTLVVWKVAGMQMLLLLSGIQAIPVDVVEAARVDGASRLQGWLYITLPLLRPTLALVLVFSVAGSLLSFDQFYILTAGGPANSTITAVYDIYRTSFIKFDLGYGATQSVLLMVLLAIVSAVQLLLLRNTDNS